jgi:hypothetical protein
MSFRSAPALYGLQSSSKDHGGAGRFARRGILSVTTLGRVGTDQAVSKARLTIDAALSDQSHVTKNVETFRLPLHYINPTVRR